MEQEKRKRLEAKGWKFGGVQELLELTPEEERYIEFRLLLSRSVREIRKEQKMTQKELARRLGSSQSRVAKIEAGDRSISLDLLCKSLFVMGLSLQGLADLIADTQEAR